ncbi:uncharacterized protein LOC105442346 [Strongylocentrotus purpuratus]|uniref:Uncharacterized protein n=1 Tax=Strongylocentrotus purpuratus TaxID=7668 RepID=A0A7M7NPR8_STRPU|nr:uncharacterized protein LOC105442346 [Strongylocentrotus purpuratus]
MKGTILVTLVVLIGLVTPHVNANNLEDLFDEEGDFQMFLDEEAIGDVLAASWFSKAIHDAGSWTKKAVKDAGDWTKKAASDVADTVKKGCGVVNSLPGKELELMKRRDEVLRKRGISEDQIAAVYGGYKNLKNACSMLG